MIIVIIHLMEIVEPSGELMAVLQRITQEEMESSSIIKYFLGTNHIGGSEQHSQNPQDTSWINYKMPIQAHTPESSMKLKYSQALEFPLELQILLLQNGHSFRTLQTGT